MRKTAVVVLILFFVVLGFVLFYSLNNQNHLVPVNGNHQQKSNAFGLLDSRGNGV